MTVAMNVRLVLENFLKVFAPEILTAGANSSLSMDGLFA
jgi:hypothetical protein